MEYDVIKRPTNHSIKITAKEVETAVMEWLDRNATVDIPDVARLYLSDDKDSDGTTGRIQWTSDDIEANPLNTEGEVD